MGRATRFFRALFSPRLGVNGSAASSAPPPGHAPIGVETNAVWHASGRDVDRPDDQPDERPDDRPGER